MPGIATSRSLRLLRADQHADSGSGGIAAVRPAIALRREALRGGNRLAVVHRAETALGADLDLADVASVWAALLVLIYADRLPDVAVQCDRVAHAAGPRAPEPLRAVIALARARVAMRTGDVGAARTDLRALLAGRVSASLLGVTRAWLVECEVHLGELKSAYRVLADETPPAESPEGRAHLLAASGALHGADGNLERGLADYLECGRVLAGSEVANPAVIPWRSKAALAAVGLDRTDLATALADDELADARRWGSPGAVGCALHAAGMARRDDTSPEVLERSVELLELANDTYDLMPALCDLGRLYADNGELQRAVEVYDSATELATATGNQAWARRAMALLPTLYHQPRAVRLTKQEHKIAAFARDGYSNKLIAEVTFLTVRTVEFHLSNVYRKLGISGRHQLPGAMAPRSCA
ncbi:helix-turn-helix transcriptional regulator [Nocardia sp. NPDC004415]